MKHFAKICEDMDADSSGTISLQELLEGYDRDDRIQQEMTLMDIEREEIACIYKLFDTENTDELPYESFIAQLYRCKNRNTTTLLMLIKHRLQEIHSRMEEQTRTTRLEVLQTMEAQTLLLLDIHARMMDMQASRSAPMAQARIPQRFLAPEP